MLKNITYNPNNQAHRRQVLDLFVPRATKNYPLLIFVSGGGWTTGSKAWITNVGTTFAAKGIGVAAIDHRLIPEVTYQEQVADLALAFAWLKKNITNYQGDPSRFIIGGHSAGAHLIGLLATDERYLAAIGYDASDIIAVILISAPLELPQKMLAISSPQETSPLTYLNPGSPPFLLLHAEDDLPDIANQTRKMVKRLKELEIAYEKKIISKRDHFGIVRKIGTPSDKTTLILDKWLKSNFGE